MLEDVDWRIDYSSHKSYSNWVDPLKLNLTCESQSMIGLIGSAYFLGFAVSSAITPRLGDKYGRKRPYIFSLIMQSFAYFVIILSKSLNLTLVCYLLVGLSAGGRVAVGTNYLSEFIPQKQQSLVITLLLAADAVVMII